MAAPSVASGNRGAVLVHVAILMFVLLAVSALAIDLGVMWLSRGQAQNAADAGAHAAAVSLAFDGNDKTSTGPAVTKAVATANQNSVFGQAAGVTPDDVWFDPDPRGNPWPAPCTSEPGTCVRVNVYRNQAHNNALPVFFARLFGITEQGVQAMAVAQSATAVSADCLRPWAISDKWVETVHPVGALNSTDLNWDDGWSPGSVYDRYLDKGAGLIPAPPLQDLYTPPTLASMGSGFSNKDAAGLPLDYGKLLSINLGQLNQWSPGWAMKLDFPLSSGGADYTWNIKNCNPGVMQIASPDEKCDPATLPADKTLWFARGCFSVLPGGKVGDTDKAVMRDADALWQKDIDAGCNSHWDWAANGGKGGIVMDAGCTLARSPRLVPVPLYDVDLYAQHVAEYNGLPPYTGTNGIIKMVNIVGFFIEGYCQDLPLNQQLYLGCNTTGADKDIIGRLVNYPGMKAGSYNGQASFIQVIRLVR